MHYYIAQSLRLGLHNGIDIGNVIELAHRLCDWYRGELHHIDTHRQRRECQRILKELIRFLAREDTCLLGSNTLDKLLHLLITVIVRRRCI